MDIWRIKRKYYQFVKNLANIAFCLQNLELHQKFYSTIDGSIKLISLLLIELFLSSVKQKS